MRSIELVNINDDGRFFLIMVLKSADFALPAENH